MVNNDCLFCKIAYGEEPSTKVWENEEFLCFRNKYPVAPVHVLVVPKAHISKTDVISPDFQNEAFWSKIMGAVFAVVRELKLDKTGYKLVNNGGGYNHFDHEHIHILGGTKSEPGGST